MKKITVIMLTYNHENTIEQAVRSVLDQKTDYSFEIMIFDDASTDKTSDILRKLKKEYPDIVKPVIREKNLGMKKNAFSAMSSIDKNSGDYIASVEGDDYWTDIHKLQKQVQFLENNPDFSAVHHKFTIIDENGEENTQEFFFEGDEYTYQELKNFEMPGQTATFLARNVFKDPEVLELFLKSAKKIRVTPPDRLYAIFFLKFGRIKILPDNMSVYRMCFNEDSNSWTSKNRKNWSRYRLLESGWRREMEKFSKDIGAPVDYFEFNSALFNKDLQDALKSHNLNSYAFVLLTFLINHRRFSILKDSIKKTKKP